jgi:hypothetical protein
LPRITVTPGVWQSIGLILAGGAVTLFAGWGGVGIGGIRLLIMGICVACIGVVKLVVALRGYED